LHAESPAQSYAFAAWAMTTLTTLALSAWVTLAVVQVALHSRKFDMYGLPAYSAIQTQIRFLCFHICSRILRENNEKNLLNSIYSSSMTELPQLMDDIEKMLIERSYEVTNDRERSLTQIEVDEIRNFCLNLDNWWNTMEPMLIAAGENALRTETVHKIYAYRHNMMFFLGGIKHLLEDTGNESLLIDLIREITALNKNIYNNFLAEIEHLE
jgi:hypothetical protein